MSNSLTSAKKDNKDRAGGGAGPLPPPPTFCGKNIKFSKIISKNEKYFQGIIVVG